jgi:NAD-dependent dihydropyrimidine dehydrogenase PreA subunit
MTRIEIDLEKCNGDGTCAEVCPVGVFEITKGKAAAVRPEECLACMACEVQCPNGAIKVIEE